MGGSGTRIVASSSSPKPIRVGVDIIQAIDGQLFFLLGIEYAYVFLTGEDD